MDYVPLELTLISAKDLKDVNLFSKMAVYAVVSMSGDPYQNQKVKTPVDREGGKNPAWNFPMKFTVNEPAARQNRLILEIKLRSERMAGDRDIGVVHVPVKELLDQPGDGKSAQFVSYQVRKPSGKPKGSLNFSYKFGEKVAAPAIAASNMTAAPVGVSKDEPVMAYPPPGVGSSSAPPYAAPYPKENGYPPPPPPPQYAAGYGYPPPPYQGGYPPAYGGYPPPQPGYGYPPVQQPAKKKNKFGMGLGAGLLGGALGGLLIGDMVSDAAAYDAGFDDGGGFDGGFDF